MAKQPGTVYVNVIYKTVEEIRHEILIDLLREIRDDLRALKPKPFDPEDLQDFLVNRYM